MVGQDDSVTNAGDLTLAEIQHNAALEQPPKIPEELCSRLLYWFQLSLSDSDMNTAAALEESIFRKLSILEHAVRKILQLTGLTPPELTADHLCALIFVILRHAKVGGGSPPSAIEMIRFLGRLYHCLHLWHGCSEDLDHAIACYTQAMSQMPETDTEWLAMLYLLGICHYKRLETIGELSDLHCALDCFTRVVSIVPDGHPEKPTYLNHLGSLYSWRFDQLGQLQDLDLSLKHTTQAVLLTQEGDFNQAPDLANLGVAYVKRYKHLGQLADITTGIEYMSQAKFLRPSTPGLLTNLGASHLTRFKRFGHLPDLDMAVEYLEQDLSLMPENDPNKPICLGNLGSAYDQRFLRLGNLPDLEMAIEYHRQGAFLIPNMRSYKLAALSNLSSACSHLYERTGQLSDLDASINYVHDAVHSSSDGHPYKPSALGNLGASYLQRFERLGEDPDLEAAINCLHKALLLWPDCGLDKLVPLSNLGCAYSTRHQRLGQVTDLECAIECQSRALLLTPHDHPDMPALLDRLGAQYGKLYIQSGQPTNLDLAIQYRQQAALLEPEDHPSRAITLKGLAETYYARFMRLGTLEDLDLAIEHMHLAVPGIGSDNSHTSNGLFNLGRYLCIRHFLSHDAVDASSSIDCLKRAAYSPASDPRDRSKAANRWASLSVIFQPETSLEAYQHFMSLIPQVVWLGMAVERRYDRVAEIADGILEAAVIAVWNGAPGKALEWLEQGRSIIWNQLLQLRSPLDELRGVDAPLAEELILVANQLQGAAALNTAVAVRGQGRHEHDSQQHRRLVERWEQLVHQAQSLPGMGNFLAPKTASYLMMAAQTRTIVVVIVTKFQCLALVVRQQATEVTSVELPNFSYEKAVHARERQLRQTRSVVRADRKFTKEPVEDDDNDTVLGMLWTDVANPVLDFLGYKVALPLSELPHITWCTTGPLSFLPLHAAGDYKTQPPCALSDYCISSYTPTIAALLAPPVEPSTFSGIATVGQASTPGCSPLPGTALELDNIAKHSKCVQITRLEGGDATCEAVMNAIERHSWVHLACHASQNAVDPVASAFRLHDRPLDLATITRKHVKHADLAFLSACQTATGDEVLTEEAVHLAAGMIMAGYRTVVATMWPIQDSDAPLVADWFYEYMLRDGVPDSRKAARALHYAVRCLRDKVGVDAYNQWAPYIHIGI